MAIHLRTVVRKKVFLAVYLDKKAARFSVINQSTLIGSKHEKIGSKTFTIGSKLIKIGSKLTTIGSKPLKIGSKIVSEFLIYWSLRYRLYIKDIPLNLERFSYGHIFKKITLPPATFASFIRIISCNMKRSI